MTAHEAVLAERRRNRRIARRIELAIVILIAAAAAAVYFGYHPEGADAAKLCSAKNHPCRARASFYNHVDACKGTLRGSPGDDDVHNWGVATGATSFGGWGAYGHYSDGSAYVWGAFNYSYGKVVSYRGRCSGGDYVSDWFEGF
jgi:hypothetical protein